MVAFVLSPGARIDLEPAGYRLYHSSAPALASTGLDRSVLELVERFRTPVEPADVLALEPPETSSDTARRIHELAALSVLVPASDADVPPATPATAARELAERRRRLQTLVYDDGGMTVTNCGKSELSRGCQACKEGAWLCIFAGVRCNATCKFCPQPADTRTLDEGEVGDRWIEELLAGIEAYGPRLKGVSLSGGEPMLYERVVGRIARFVRDRLPGTHLWSYTNGIAATPEALQRFRDFGLDEMRFNLAATDFNRRILALVRDHAVKLFPWVTIEVPMYLPTYRNLVEKEHLRALDEMGVRQINLGQLYDGTESSAATRNFRDVCASDGSGTPTEAMLEIRHRTYDVFEYAERHGLRIRINDCSEDGKKLQATARDRIGGPEMLALMQLAYPRPSPPADVRSTPPGAELTECKVIAQRLRSGSSRRPRPEDVALIRFIGWADGGRPVASSYPSGLEGVPVRLAAMPAAVQEALSTMGPGGKSKLWGHGSKFGFPDVPWMVLELELLALRPEVLPFEPSTARALGSPVDG